MSSLPAVLTRPDILVLGGGGVLGEAWISGVLAGIEDASGIDMRECEHFVGTSAGSIVAANLAAGRRPRRPSSTGTEVERIAAPPPTGLAAGARVAARKAGELTLAAWTPLAPLALSVTGPGGSLVRSALLARIPAGRQRLDDLRDRIDALGSRFDGRLRIAAVDRLTGRRVVFGSPGAPPATIAQAVTASCSVPWLFAPVWIAGREYVDGGVWSVSNLDVAPVARDTHVLCLNPTSGISSARTAVAAVRNIIRSAVSLEALALRRRGAIVQTIGPDADSATAMGANFMDAEPRGRVLAAGYVQGRALRSRT
jgi:NTE family protein